jgi:hypothetical protein
VGARVWMLCYAEGEVRPVLQAAPPIDRAATRALIARLYPGRHVTELADGPFYERACPPDHHVYAACFPGLTLLCTAEAALDRPSELDPRFLAEAAGRTVYLYAMHNMVDWFAYAVWDGAGTPRRALSLSPDDGIMQNTGAALPFEEPFWAGERRLPPFQGEEYPLPFHPLELGEEALRALFGFNFEGLCRDDDPDLLAVRLAGFAVYPATDA